MSRHAAAGLLSDTASHDTAVDYAVQLLWSEPYLSGIYYGNEYGLWGAARETKDLVNKCWRWKEDLAADVSQGKYVYVDRSGKVHSQKTFQDTWDTRLRPWYSNSRGVPKPYWSDPYAFMTEHAEVGISVVYDVLAPDGSVSGITEADITLDELSRFLRTHTVGKGGVGLIIDTNGKVVCTPNMADAVIATEANKLRLRNISELPEYPYLSEVVSRHAHTAGGAISVSQGGVKYLVSIADFPKSFGRPWKLILIAPKADFVSATKRNAMVSAIISAVLLVLGILLIFMISRRISRPLVRLTKETEKIHDLDLDGDVGIVSRILEIDMIASSISRLKVGLRAFQKYVPSELVKELVRTGEDIRLGGRQEILTIFFTDIADFATISEELPPEHLSLHLSDYFNELTKIIQECGGTVDKYIGDAIMAFWGAPVRNPEQEVNACRAAVLCQRRLAELNASWRNQGKPAFVTRIGIHTGPTVVGNVGAEDRMNYTILGDSVNVASRLEGTNKVFGTGIIVSESTVSKLSDSFITRPLDYVVVKGRTEALKIFEVMDLNDGMASEKDKRFAEEFTGAFELFRDRDWHSALEKVEKILSEYPNDVASLRLKARCLEHG